MQAPALYIAVALVGAAADLGTNVYLQNRTTIYSPPALALKEFYNSAPAYKTAFYASVTFVLVFFIADVLVTLFTQK